MVRFLLSRALFFLGLFLLPFCGIAKGRDVLRLTLQESKLLYEVLGKVDVTPEEIDAFLLIYGPLEKSIASYKSKSKQPLVFKWSTNMVQDLLLFLGRYKMVGGEAKPLGEIIKKIRSGITSSNPKSSHNNSNSPVAVKIDLTLTHLDLQLIQHILSQVEISAREMSAYLALVDPLDKVVPQDAPLEDEIKLSLPQDDVENLLIFLHRYSFLGNKADSFDLLVQKIRGFLPEGSKFYKASPLADGPKTNLRLTTKEANILYAVLGQIQVSAVEAAAFLEVYRTIEPIAQLTQATGEVSFTQDAYQNLLVFMRRYTLPGYLVIEYNRLLSKIEERIIH